VVSGSLSSPFRGAFHLSLTVLVHYRSLEVLSLGEWSPQLPTRFHVSRGTQDTDPPHLIVLDGTLTRSGHAFQRVGVIGFGLLSVLQPQRHLTMTLVWAPPGSLATTTGISVDFFSSGY
jgi:hypothetical protein